MIPTSRGRGPIASPFDALWDVRREFDRVFNGMSTQREQVDGPWSVPAEVMETGEAIRFDLEVPGMKIEDLNVTLENNILTISGEKKFERAEDEQGEYRVFERRYGHFERSFRVPSNVSAEAIRATYENGILTINLPKTEESRPRRIAIESGSGEGARQVSSS